MQQYTIKLLPYWLIAIYFSFSIASVNSSAEDHQSVTLSHSPVKLHGEIDIIISSCTAAGITLSSPGLPTIIDSVRLGSPAFYANLAKKDKIISAMINNNKLALLIERQGRRFSTKLNISPIDQHMNVKPESLTAADVLHSNKLLLQGEALYTKLADDWIKAYTERDNRELQIEINQLQEEVCKRVESNGGQWHIAAYYQSKKGDPKFLLCNGIRLYAIGDLDDAMRLFEEVLKHDSHNTDAYFNLGAVYENKSEFQLAISYYKQALKYKPFDLEIQKAINTVGQVPVVFQGGAFGAATSIKDLHSAGLHITDTCDFCQILRDGAMHGG